MFELIKLGKWFTQELPIIISPTKNVKTLFIAVLHLRFKIAVMNFVGHKG